MQTIQWDANRHALASEMDKEHRQSVQLIRQLAQASAGEERMRLEELCAYCEDHFAREMAWMQTYSLPLPEGHVRDHAAIMTRLMDLDEAMLRGRTGAAREACGELFAWFDQHFRTYDAALALCMSKGKPSAGPGIPAVG